MGTSPREVWISPGVAAVVQDSLVLSWDAEAAGGVQPGKVARSSPPTPAPAAVSWTSSITSQSDRQLSWVRSEVPGPEAIRSGRPSTRSLRSTIPASLTKWRVPSRSTYGCPGAGASQKIINPASATVGWRATNPPPLVSTSMSRLAGTSCTRTTVPSSSAWSVDRVTSTGVDASLPGGVSTHCPARHTPRMQRWMSSHALPSSQGSSGTQQAAAARSAAGSARERRERDMRFRKIPQGESGLGSRSERHRGGAPMKVDRQLGFLLLGIWLVVYGLSQIVNLHFSGLPMLMGILAMASGVLLIIRR